MAPTIEIGIAGLVRIIFIQRIGDDDLPRLVPSPQAEREHLAEELATALSRLRAVHASYWDHDWRREHRGFGRYPEHHLWEAVHSYLDLYDAAESAD